jgi:glycosyltransferase involved in cell wall biosynthesis
MRIAFVYDAVYPYILGGVERRVWELSHRLAKRGHEIHVFGMQLWEGDETLIQGGVAYHGVCKPRKLYQKGKRKISQAITFGSHVFLPLARKHFDVIDCQQFPYFPAIALLFSCRISKSPLVITWHEVWGEYWYDYLGIHGSIGKFLERVLAHSNGNNIAVSESTSNDLKGLTRSHEDVPIIPNGIDLSDIEIIPPSDQVSDLIFAGRLIREKHVNVLLESLVVLKKSSPSIRCTIIGDGPERENLEFQAKTLGISENVLFTGFLKDSSEVIARMKGSKVFVLPSTREGFGITAIEAIACGLPIVTIDHPQNASRVFARSGCGRLSTLDPTDLSESISMVLAKSEERGPACISVARQYDWEKITDRIEEYYSIISGSSM